MNKLTTKELQALSVADNGRNLREDGGIVGRVRSGLRGTSVSFRFEYKLNGAKQDYALGTWPKKSLADIRAERDRVRVVVTEGIDPGAAKKAARIEQQRAIEATIAQAEAERKSRLRLPCWRLFLSRVVAGRRAGSLQQYQSHLQETFL